MSVRTSGSVDRSRQPESLYGDASVADRDYPSPSSGVQDDNQRIPGPDQDPNSPPPTAGVASTVFTTPSHRSQLVELSEPTRDALDKLYKFVYGEDSRRCLFQQTEDCLNAAHIVQRATESHQLTLYEYCLGCVWRTFHVDSRRNLLYLDISFHTSFDQRKWLLLPEMTVLEEVRDFVKEVLAARKDTPTREIRSFQTRWSLILKTPYTLIPLPGLERRPFVRRFLKPVESPQPAESIQYAESFELQPYPYNQLPPLECHVSPALMVINAGPKLAQLDLDVIALNYHDQLPTDAQNMLKQRLELVCEIWALFENAKGDAEKWEVGNSKEKEPKRSRDDDDDDIDSLPQAPKRTTRSQPDSGKSPDAARGPSGSTTKARSEPKRTSGSRKRRWACISSAATLTEDAVFHLGKRPKTTDFIKHWVESTRASTVNDNSA